MGRLGGNSLFFQYYSIIYRIINNLRRTPTKKGIIESNTTHLRYNLHLWQQSQQLRYLDFLDFLGSKVLNHYYNLPQIVAHRALPEAYR